MRRLKFRFGKSSDRSFVFRLAASLLTVAVCLLTCGWTDNWESIRAGTQTIKTIKAEFIQEKHLTILAKPLISKGCFYFQPPDSLRWEYAEPVKSVLMSLRQKVKRYVEIDGRFAEDASARLEAMQIVLKEITRWLNGNFTDNPDFHATLDSSGKVTLTAVNSALSAMIQRIEIGLAETPGLIHQVHIYEHEKSYTVLKFIGPSLNVDINELVFQQP